MNYRMARQSDIPQLVELRMLEQENDWKGEYPIDENLKQDTQKAFEERLNQSLFVAVAEEDGKIVATAAVIPHLYLPQADEHSGRRAYLCNVFTLQEYRRRGIQIELQAFLYQFAKQELHIARLDLHASDGEAVSNLYQKLGWRFVTNNARLFL